MTYEELLGPDPYEGCRYRGRGACYDCHEDVIWRTKRDLLEALKAGGEKVKENSIVEWGEASWRLADRCKGPGTLIFIPKAQG